MGGETQARMTGLGPRIYDTISDDERAVDVFACGRRAVSRAVQSSRAASFDRLKKNEALSPGPLRSVGSGRWAPELLFASGRYHAF